MKNHFLITLLLLMLVGFGTSCSRQMVLMPGATDNDGRYDTEFPGPAFARALDNISESVLKIYCLAEYDRYYIDTAIFFTQSDLAAGLLSQRTIMRDNFSESVHGSATLLRNSGGRLVLLTCAHIFDYPDTVVSYYESLDYSAAPGIESVAIKRKQTQFIQELSVSESFEIIAIDYDLDIAFLGTKNERLTNAKLPAFDYAAGDDRMLDRGSVVYVFGFPAGFQMVTRALVANPNIGKNGAFLVNANFNEGISGGAVMAMHDGPLNLQLVGIAKSASASYSNVIKPEHESHQQRYNPNLPYEGPLFVEQQRTLNYGVTFAISILTIRDFYLLNRRRFVASGYNLDEFFQSGTRKKRGE
jgi:hypothetical protein